MKKNLLGIVAVVLAIALSAFTNENTPQAEGQVYTWAKTNLDGTIPMNPQKYTGTASGARSAFGCPDGIELFCAKAVNENNQEIPDVDPLRRDL